MPAAAQHHQSTRVDERGLVASNEPSDRRFAREEVRAKRLKGLAPTALYRNQGNKRGYVCRCHRVILDERASDYQQLTAAGRLGDAGQKLEALKRKLEALQRRRQQ